MSNDQPKTKVYTYQLFTVELEGLLLEHQRYARQFKDGGRNFRYHRNVSDLETLRWNNPEFAKRYHLEGTMPGGLGLWEDER